MKYNKLLFATIIITTLITFSINTYSQNAASQKFKLAQSYEQAGDVTNAARLYEELYNQNKNNDEYFDGLIRNNKALSKFSYILPFVEEKLKTERTIDMLTLYGELLWRLGKTSEAQEAWDNAIKIAPKNPDIYSIVAETQIQLKLFDKAIIVLENGRKAMNNKSIYSDLMSQLYIATGNYKEGTNEVINLYEQNQNLAQAQGRLGALMINNNAKSFIRDNLKNLISSRNNINYLRLYVWFLRANNDYENAFEITKQIDEMSNSTGNEILAFASNSQRDGQYDVASRAYGYLIDNSKNQNIVLSSLYGYAYTLEQKFSSNDSIQKPIIEDIINRYRTLINKYSGSQTAADCYFRIANLELYQLKDKEASAKDLLVVINNFSSYPLAARAGIMLGSIYIMDNKLTDASEIINKIIKKYERTAPDQIDNAKFLLAELDFYEGNIDSAYSQYQFLSNYPQSDIANDAMRKALLISVNKVQEKALREYSQAELKEFQQDYATAIKLYFTSVETAPNTDLSEQCYIKIAKIQLQQKHYIESRNILDTLMQKSPDSIYGDYAMLLISDNYLAENRVNEAIKILSDILTNYPSSIYLQEVRDKIRKLRADKNI